jgi:hypothetical protein
VRPIRRLFRLDRGARAVPRDVEDELRLHLELRAAELEAEGWNPEAARAEAARLFGSVDAHRTS